MATRLFIFWLALSALTSSSAALRIDCGSDAFFNTNDDGTYWTGDEAKSGEAQETSNSISTVMNTLRVFKSGNKNCYSLPFDKSQQIIVRASFFYGNYDKKSLPPSFDLLFDGNLWATVETSSTNVTAYEAIYVPKGESTSVCVAQTKPDQFPFISALEAGVVGSHMYNQVDSTYALFTLARVAYGSSSALRDAYDRVWITETNNYTSVASDEFLVATSNAEDDPPSDVLLNAITSLPTTDLDLVTYFPSTTEVPIYLTMYFSEVMVLDTTQKRSFQIYKDRKPISDPILPPYGGVIEKVFTNMTASSDTKFSLVATSDSNFPPIISAMEAFIVSEKMTNGTNSDDVEGLSALQDSVTGFELLQVFGGDPCLPAPYSWDWINCTSSSTPRVTVLDLSGYSLEGSLPDFSSMTALETIDLSKNSLTGEIPDFLGSLPNLKKLNLADNQFSGAIPDSLTKNSKLTLVTTGNSDLCKPGKSCDTTDSSSPGLDDPSGTSKSSSGRVKTKKKSKTGSIVGGTVGSFLGLWVIAGVTALCHRRRKRAAVTAMAMNGIANNKANGVQMGENVMNQFASTTGEQVEVDLTDQQASETAH